MTAGEPLVVWINGAFGVGKSAVAEQLVQLLPDAIVFDPEPHGALLRAALPDHEQPDDFQDLPAWRELTRATVVSLARSRHGVVVVPMTLVDDMYFEEIVGRIRHDGVRLLHVSLIAPAQVVTARLRARPGNNDWALDRVARCVSVLGGAQFGEHMDAAGATPRELAVRIQPLARARAAEAPA